MSSNVVSGENKKKNAYEKVLSIKIKGAFHYDL